ncbi:MAG: RraA family protein [Armatimonadota bacterium]|nr:RraA family protein [Armatimonadota bacterium]MDR7437395.1 RraA family protein [Armatimonadota bacterium]MDR7506860.1 RraA family protein [Armatimonadota bacterium]MDR7517472.1 RraA family protein [Armatimonadota bacterium]MDR7560496.1 RraA family protein [Armatimonadota bacterium]
MIDPLDRAVRDRWLAVTTASVADAVDRVIRRRGFMAAEIKPLAPVRIVGPAVTVLERRSLEAHPPRHALDAIDEAPPGSIIVIATDDPEAARDVALWGGLMTVAAVTRGLGGVVLDGGVRDAEEIRREGLAVFARSVVPSTTVGRYATVARDIPVVCGGVPVHPGDIVVGDGDGVVVVPREAAAEVLAAAEQIEQAERAVAQRIREVGSIRRAVEEFARI